MKCAIDNDLFIANADKAIAVTTQNCADLMIKF